MKNNHPKVVAFVPLKLNSRRLPNKNFLRLGDRPLAYHIFSGLLNVKKISSVLCYTSQPQIMRLLPPEVELLMRPKSLDGDEVKANELFKYAVENIDADIIVLCHATGPFVTPNSIEKGIDALLSGDYNCAFSVAKHKTYAWYDGKPLNYDPQNMAQTQNLKEIYCETSGFYIFKKEKYLETGTRISDKPCLIEVDVRESIDIDEPNDFKLAMHMLNYDATQNLDLSKDNFFVDMAGQSAIGKNIKHISFDLDGVLIDSLSLMEEAWDYSMKELNLDYSFSEYKKGIGIPFFSILDQIGVPKEFQQPIADLYNDYSKKNIHKIDTDPTIASQLERLKLLGVKLSVVTSKAKIRAHEIIDKVFGNELFDCIICPEDVPSGRGKPSPDAILLTCSYLGVDPFNTIYIGDMDVDREAAVRAGAHFVYANWGYGDIEKIKDVWFNSFEDLTEYIESVVNI